MKTVVRCPDRMVFEVNPKTLDPIRSSCYDAYCFSDLEKDTEYIEYYDWLLFKDKVRNNEHLRSRC